MQKVKENMRKDEELKVWKDYTTYFDENWRKKVFEDEDLKKENMLLRTVIKLTVI